MGETQRIHEVLRRVERRLRWQRLLDLATRLVAAATFVALVPLFLFRLHLGGEAAVVAVAVLPAVAFAGALAYALLKPIPERVTAKAVDRSHDLADRIGNAVELAAKRPADELEASFVRAVERDAARHVDRVDVRRAAPIRSPRGLRRLAAAVVAVGLLAWVRLPARARSRPSPRAATAPAAGDLDAAYDIVARLDERAREHRDTKLAALVASLRGLLDQYRRGAITKTDLLQRIAEIEAHAFAGQVSNGSFAAQAKTLSAMATDLARGTPSQSLARALAQDDTAAAAEAAAHLGERLSDHPTAAEREALEKALADAAREQRSALAQREADLAQAEHAAADALRRLQRDAPQSAPSQDPDQTRRLDRDRRELERLTREQQATQERERELEKLQRDLDQASQDLASGAAGDAGAAGAMSQAGEDLGRMQQEQSEQQDGQVAQGEVAQLKQVLIRTAEGAQGAQQAEKLRDFARRARGESGAQSGSDSSPEPGQQGQQGQQANAGSAGSGAPQAGSGEAGGQGDSPNGESGGAPGRQAGSGQGQAGASQGTEVLEPGNGQNPGDGKTYLLGQGGSQQLSLPGAAHESSQTTAGGLADGRPGTEHDDHLYGDGTDLGGAGRSVRVAGQQASGPSRSEIIYGSAQHGFASRDYERVYTEYNAVTEQTLDRQQVPPGYRYLVKRYFQLIEPPK